jgi:hypothetical protein
VCESWLDEKFTSSLLVNGSCYELIRHDRNTGHRGGGVCDFIKKSLLFIQI